MKNLVLMALMLVLVGCSDGDNRSEKEAVKAVANNVSALTQACIRIGECLGAKVQLRHFSNQTHAPYACDVTVDEKRQVYLYPDAQTSFGSVDAYVFENALTVCHLAKKSGEYSDAAIKARRKALALMEIERANRKRAAQKPKIPTLPIVEGQ